MKWIKKSFLPVLVFLICLLPMSAQAAPRVQETGEKIVIVIDPGHGGENRGTIENGFEEKTMTLTTALAMYDELSLYDDVEVFLTRMDDRDLSLKERAEYAADVNADFMFSLHFNASLNHTLFGSEVWVPSAPPYNAYAYQFGYVQMNAMRDMGISLHGIKTRINDKNLDYYGIIREAVSLSVPVALIEHCYVDEERDISFCDTDEKLAALGKADAASVAKYFGLKSESLQVDYSEESSRILPEVSETARVQATLLDKTPPDVCMVEVAKADYNTGEVSLYVSAADYDTPLLYYDYSIDGGETYSPLQLWPETDVLEGTYQDTFTLDLVIPSGTLPTVVVRAYNQYDLYTESNFVHELQVFRYGEEEKAADGLEQAAENAEVAENTEAGDAHKLPGTTSFLPASAQNAEEESGEVSFLTFLQICLVFVVLIFLIVLVSQALSYRRRKKRRRQRRKEVGERKNQSR